MGIYLFDAKALVRRLTEDAQDSSSSHDFGYAVIPRMAHLDRVFAYEFKGYWQDIGTIESYYQSNMMLVAGSPSFSLDDTWPIFTKKDGLAEGTISNKMNNSLVSPGCVIEGRVENSVLSPGVRIEPEALVRKSVIMANCVIGRHSVIDHCILDEGVNIGEFSYVGFGASLVPGSFGITVVGRGATIPSHTAIGRNCKIYPGIEPTTFRTEVVPPGTVVSPK
jgi:glucose-1-phosphate adenylyltransferase